MRRRIAAIHPKATLGQATALMVTLDADALPVLDISDVLVGMLTRRDILRRVHFADDPSGLPRNDDFDADFCAAARRNAHDRLVEEVMTPEVCSVHEDTLAPEVLRLMQERQIKRLPVLRGNKLVGLISRSDLSETLGADGSGATSEDGAIKAAVIAALDRLRWAPCPLIEITVASGRVEMRGTLVGESERHVLRATVESLPGVTGFCDHLVSTAPLYSLFAEGPEDLAEEQKLK